MTDILQRSWSGFPSDIAKRYLKDWGAPSPRSKQVVVELLQLFAREATRPVRVLDLGCGNGQLLEALRASGNSCEYTGVDFSDSLLAAARDIHADDPHARFVKDDVQVLQAIQGPFDLAIYSHVLEILGSPELSLRRARELAPRIVIRFFEPPEFEVDTVELREMDPGDGHMVPYLRRKMSRDFYRLILTGVGATRVEIYQADGDKDQVHVLHFD